MTPSVSVIIPTYNRWPIVCEAIESVLCQSYRGFELTVVDDESGDATSTKLQRYGARLEVICQPRRGVAAARNFGVRCCRGEYIAFLDSDDLWAPGKLETQVAFMQAHPGIRICQTEEIWERNGVRVNPKKKHRKPSGDIFRASLDLCLVSPSAVMMTKELFDEAGGFDEAFSVCEDYDLWLRVAVDEEVPLIPEPLVVKRGGHRDQLSRSTWGLDRYRVFALSKLLRSGLQDAKREWVLEVMKKKVAILAQGARKRGKETEARIYEGVLAEFADEVDHEGADFRLRQNQRIPPADSGTLA